MTPEFKRYLGIEESVFKAAPEAVRKEMDQASVQDREHIKMAVMTRIAIGDPELEAAFPEFAHANPDNHDWSAHSSPKQYPLNGKSE